MSLQFVFLTPQFYMDYAHCPEIEQKPDRPHVRILVRAGGVDFAIPMRSHIRHPHAFITDAANQHGLDFSKAIVLTDFNRYVDAVRHPHIRQNEFDALRGKEHIVEQGMLRYIRQYQKAKNNLQVPRNARLVQYSTLQYFESYLPHLQ